MSKLKACPWGHKAEKEKNRMSDEMEIRCAKGCTEWMSVAAWNKRQALAEPEGDIMKMHEGKPAIQHAYEYIQDQYKRVVEEKNALEERQRKALASAMVKAGHKVTMETTWGDLLIALTPALDALEGGRG